MHLRRHQREHGGWIEPPCGIFHSRSSILALVMVWSFLCIVGCERRSGTSVALPTRTIAEFKPLTQLLHNKLAHVTCDSLGNVFYTTETEKGQDVLFVIT